MNDKDKIKAIQLGIGAYPDGVIGSQTIDTLYRKFANVIYPYSEQFFGGIVIFTKDIKIEYSQNKKATNDFMNSISGVFQWDGKAISVLIENGKVINNFASHTWLNKPETILYKTKHGCVNAIRAISVPVDLVPDIEWAIGGLGLHNYDPIAEGFTGAYADVLRNTGHTGIGITKENEIALLYKKCSGQQFRDWAINKLGLKFAIMLDGGHIASVSSSKLNANTLQKQNNIIRAI